MMGRLRLVAALVCGLMLFLTAGCNILGPAFLLVHGPAKTHAKFEPEKQRPTVVFVDDRASVLPRRVLRQQIARSTETTLLKEGVLKNVIDSTAAVNAAAHEPAGEPLDIASLARAVQAEVVIYISINGFALSSDRQTFLPEASYNVKVIDITKDNPRVWPAEHEGFPITVAMKQTSAVTPTTAAGQAQALTALADRSGVAIAQLFFKHDAYDTIGK